MIPTVLEGLAEIISVLVALAIVGALAWATRELAGPAVSRAVDRIFVAVHDYRRRPLISRKKKR